MSPTASTSMGFHTSRSVSVPTPGPSGRWLVLCTLAIALIHALLLAGINDDGFGSSAAPVVRLDTRLLSPAPTTPATALARPAPPPPTSAAPLPEIPADTPATVATEPTPIAPPPSVPPSAIATAAPLAVALPASGRLDYTVQGRAKGLDYTASAELLFEHDGQTYTARWTVGAFLMGSRTDTSRGQIGPGGLMPVRYGQKSRSEKAAHFDRQAQTITFSSNRPAATLAPGAQDRLSVLIQLASLLAANPAAWPADRQISLQVASTDYVDTWNFRVSGMHPVEADGRTIDAIRLERIGSSEYAQKVEVWFAPALGYMPVRIRLSSSNGDIVDQLWRNTQH